jgi:hypothetical protein
MYVLYVQNPVSTLLVPRPPLHVFSSQFCQLSILTVSLSVVRVDVIVSSCQFSKRQFSIKFAIKILYVFVVSLLSTFTACEPLFYYLNSSMCCVIEHYLANHNNICHKPHIYQWKWYLLQIPVSVCLLIVFIKHCLPWEDSKSRVR